MTADTIEARKGDRKGSGRGLNTPRLVMGRDVAGTGPMSCIGLEEYMNVASAP